MSLSFLNSWHTWVFPLPLYFLADYCLYINSKCFMLLLLPVIITLLKVLNQYLVDFANNDIFTISLPICDFSYS